MKRLSLFSLLEVINLFASGSCAPAQLTLLNVLMLCRSRSSPVILASTRSSVTEQLYGTADAAACSTRSMRQKERHEAIPGRPSVLCWTLLSAIVTFLGASELIRCGTLIIECLQHRLCVRKRIRKKEDNDPPASGVGHYTYTLLTWLNVLELWFSRAQVRYQALHVLGRR
jgi:hypothetical protein